MRRFLAGALAGLVLAAPLAAQEPWRASYYPYPLKGPNDQLSLVLHYQIGQAADYADRVPFGRSFSVEAGINASGSRFLVTRFKAPRMADGWRLYGEAGAVRENRFGYFGLGNDTEEADDTVLDSNPWYDRVQPKSGIRPARCHPPDQGTLSGGGGGELHPLLIWSAAWGLPFPQRFLPDSTLHSGAAVRSRGVRSG